MPLPLNDLLALLGIDLVLCAAVLRLLTLRRGTLPWSRWAVAACFILLWLPVGEARLPLLAYVRGISSDLSITLVALAGMDLGRRLLGLAPVQRRETMALNAVIALAALALYPAALGWGDWDPYRLGWGSFGLLGALLALSLAFWLRGLWLLPALVGLALLAWVAGLMESTNLWDHLIDPWLAIAALACCLRAGVRRLPRRARPATPADQAVPP